MKKMWKLLFLLMLIIMLIIMAAPFVFAAGTAAPNIVKGVWWILTAVFSAIMAYLNFSKKHQGTVPAKIMIIVNVASVVFGVIFATPWSPPGGP
jgi:hypothetical protein